MIRILAVSISAAALVAATLPANAQSRQGQGQGQSGQQFRSQGPSGFSGQRFSQGQQFQGQGQPSGQRNFRSFNPPAPSGQAPQRAIRSFNPPAPGGQSAQVQPRAFNPPAPGIGTTQRSFVPQAPTGGQNFVGGPRSVPASLPAPSLGQSTPTDAPGTPGPQQTVAAPGQPADAPQGDLQAPIPQTVTGQVEPTSAEQMPADQMPVAEGDQPAPQTVVTQGGETPVVAETRQVVKVVPGHVVRQVVHAPRYVEYYQPRQVYVPVYVQRHHYVHVPQHHGFYGHRAHHGHHGHHGYGRRGW
jgi:hypothetical protein